MGCCGSGTSDDDGAFSSAFSSFSCVDIPEEGTNQKEPCMFNRPILNPPSLRRVTNQKSTKYA
eukprot:scaffold156665_cov51-Attheya_sp.AAC.2